jgi:two-component system sensor histidine kinase DesK
MDEIRRARRYTWVALFSCIVVMWLSIAIVSFAQLTEGTLQWWRVVPALIATVCFTWLGMRLISAMLDRRYLTRQVVVAAVLAVVAAGMGGAEPFGWGVALVTWLSIATLWISRRKVVVLALGTFAVGMALAMLSVVTGSGLLTSDMELAEALVFYAFLYGVWCAVIPPSNRMVVWILTLATQAHEGREAHTRLAVAEERLRFARDLHDLVGHQLSAIAVKTELAVRLFDADAAKAEMVEVNTLTRTALRELREAVRGYRELDLPAELNSVKGVLEAAGVRCELHLPYRDLPGDVAPVFAYAVREAVTNVLKHSTASFCEITLRFTDEQAELRVRNDGVARRQAADLGSGLTGMGERLAGVGGKLTARPTDDGEFQVLAVVSLPFRG